MDGRSTRRGGEGGARDGGRRAQRWRGAGARASPFAARTAGSGFFRGRHAVRRSAVGHYFFRREMAKGGVKAIDAGPVGCVASSFGAGLPASWSRKDSSGTGASRHGVARQSRRDETRLGVAGPCGLGVAGHGLRWPGSVGLGGRGRTRRRNAGLGLACRGGHDVAGRGGAAHGGAPIGLAVRASPVVDEPEKTSTGGHGLVAKAGKGKARPGRVLPFLFSRGHAAGVSSH